MADGLVIDWLGGRCPVQAEGTVAGRRFYFRARGEHWSFAVGDDPVGDAEWELTVAWGDRPFAAGWMPEDEARSLVALGADLYRRTVMAGKGEETP